MIWWIVGGLVVLLLVVMWFRATSQEDRKTRQLVGRTQRAPVPEPPAGRWGNELPGYFVRSNHRV